MRVSRLSGIVMRIAVILLCLVLFSAHLASGMFAKYTNGSSIADTARAAKYGVTVVPASDYVAKGDPLEVDMSGNAEYKFYVDNTKSEVAVKYDLYIAFADCYDGSTKIADVDDMFKNVRLNGQEASRIATEGDRYIHYVFTNAGTLEPGTTSGEFTFTFNVSPSYTETVDTSLAANTIKVDTRYKFPIQVFVHAEQID